VRTLQTWRLEQCSREEVQGAARPLELPRLRRVELPRRGGAAPAGSPSGGEEQRRRVDHQAGRSRAGGEGPSWRLHDLRGEGLPPGGVEDLVELSSRGRMEQMTGGSASYPLICPQFSRAKKAVRARGRGARRRTEKFAPISPALGIFAARARLRAAQRDSAPPPRRPAPPSLA
jgi:hypothetical protein